MKIKICVAGASGRMGRGIVKAISQQEDMELSLAIDLNRVGEDAGLVSGSGRAEVKITSPHGLGDGLVNSGTDVLVDFTNPTAAMKNAETAVKQGVGLVIGTTGFETKHIEKIQDLVKNSDKMSAVISPNMATGVNLFFKLARETALSLGDEYDVEIIEAHHRHKKDAPSGTALRVAELIAASAGKDLKEHGVYGRKGFTGERKKGEIGLHAVRAGDIVGDHTVIFAGQGERIEITHRAHSRDAFVNGVLKAIRFLMDKDEVGKVYTTWDVLNIK